MKKLLLILNIGISINLFSGNLTVLKKVYAPKDFYVGDVVTLNIHVETPFDGELENVFKIPNGDWLDINSIIIAEIGGDETVIRVSFTSFTPGLRVMPDIVLGDHTLHDLKVQTLSILDSRFTELQPMSSQMVPSGTYVLLVFVILGFFMGPYLFLVMFRIIVRSVKVAIKKYKRERPYRNYQKILKHLKNNMNDKSVREFYISITEQLRVYLSFRFNKYFSAATTMEMSSLLKPIIAKDAREELLSICRFADLVKFNHSHASSSHLKKDLKRMIDISNQLEGKEKNSARI